MSIDQIYALASGSAYGLTTLLTWVATEAIKQTKLNNRFLPLVSVGVGALLGVLATFFVFRDGNAFLNGGFGAVVGLSTTGINEVLRNSLTAFINKGAK